jgi:pentatricopeptide repeat protein
MKLVLYLTTCNQRILSHDAMIQGYGENGKEVLELFDQMKQEGLQPNQVTYTIILSMCKSGCFVAWKKDTEIDELDIEWSFGMKTSLLNMYSKCGSRMRLLYI